MGQGNMVNVACVNKADLRRKKPYVIAWGFAVSLKRYLVCFNTRKDKMSKPETSLMSRLVSLAKRRGFVYPASEIYGGLNGFWDFGPLGVLLKNNLRDRWWHDMVECPRWGRTVSRFPSLVWTARSSSIPVHGTLRAMSEALRTLWSIAVRPSCVTAPIT